MQALSQKSSTAAAVPSTAPESIPAHRLVSLVLLSWVIMLISMSSAYAIISPMGGVLCTIIMFVFGNLGRGLAVLAVIVVGVGATLGKVSWGLAITVAIGISVVFGSIAITNMLLFSAGAGTGIGCNGF